MLVHIALLAQHYFVDELPCVSGADGKPRHACTGKGVLQGFEQRHKVPHGIHVLFHKHPNIFQTADVAVYRVIDDATAKGFNAMAKRIESIHDCSSMVIGGLCTLPSTILCAK
jgi:hypothetical protein